MGDESVPIPGDNIEYHIVALFDKIEALRSESPKFWNIPIQNEVRALEFWRSVICECLACFCYVFIVCGAVISAGPGASVASVLFASALGSGLSIAVLTQCFGHISGAHVNPAVTVAMVITKKISLFRSIMYIIAQCGGGIAGAALLYGMSAPGYQGNLATTLIGINNFRAWERFGVEFILSFMIVLTYLTTMNPYNRWFGSSSLTIGAAYSACTFVSMPYLNPARSLGPSFVLSKWENHWVYWIAPLTGGAIAGIIYKYVLNVKKPKPRKYPADGDSCIPSEEDPYDDLEQSSAVKCGIVYPKYRMGGNTVVTSSSSYSPTMMSTSFYSSPNNKTDNSESMYGVSKSLYCKSPPLTRANLNRSQSVYAKSNLRDSLPQPGPLIPARSLYSMKLNQQSHVQNQNTQNQLHQRVDVGCNTRPIGKIISSDSDNNSKFEESKKPTKRPDSLYGLSHPTDDGSYPSYYGSTKRFKSNIACTSLGSKHGSHSNPCPSRNSEMKHLTSSHSFQPKVPQHSQSSHY